MKTVVGLFDYFTQAQNAISELKQSGVPESDISLIGSNNSGQYDPYLRSNSAATATEVPTDAPSATGTGATVGTVVGGVTGLMLGMGLIAIPGFGPIAAAGWFVSTLTGAGIGALAGGLVGALTTAGVPEEEASYYNEGVRRVGTLLAVRCEDNNAQPVAAILSENGAADIDERANLYRQEGFQLQEQNTTVSSGRAVVQDTRGVGERIADAVTGDRIDDKTGKVVR